MSILSAANYLRMQGQSSASQTDAQKPTDSIGATGKAYSVFTNDGKKKPTNYFSPENLGTNLAGNIESYVKKNGNLDKLQKLELAPALTAKQSANGFASNIGGDADDYVINATTRHLTEPKNKEGLAEMCKLFGVKDNDYIKLQDAMMKANKNNDLVITRDEIEAYKKSLADNNSPATSKAQPSTFQFPSAATTNNQQTSQFPSANTTTNNNQQLDVNMFVSLLAQLFMNNSSNAQQPNQQQPCCNYNQPIFQNPQFNYQNPQLVQQQINPGYYSNVGINNGVINNGLMANAGYPQNIPTNINVTNYPGIPGLFMPPEQMTTTQKVLNGLYNLVDLIPSGSNRRHHRR
ncbi:MAG: hypothetical protein WCK67_01860 [bacterium]